MAATGVDPTVVEAALARISDGIVFERFGKAFLAALRPMEFVPVGGNKDQAIDGLEHTFGATGIKRTVYQLSIEADARGKIKRTLRALEKNSIGFKRLIYVTNRKVQKQSQLIDDLYDQFAKNVEIRDVEWFKSNVNDSEATARSFDTFAGVYLHELAQPGKAFEVANLHGDPRLYVFLRQLWDRERQNLAVHEVLADALIMYALEGTDPEAGIVMTRDEILQRVGDLVSFEVKRIEPVIDARLKVLTARPRQVKYHGRLRGYCLPYETRQAISKRNAADVLLYEEFKESVRGRAQQHCREEGVPSALDPYPLIEEILHQVFRKQGLEFADFIQSGGRSVAVEQSIPEIVDAVVAEAAVPPKDREAVQTSLLLTIREVVYHSTGSERAFLGRLARTYTMLFLLQCDPKLATAFMSMASKLKVYVCTSVLIPALSEHFLERENQRYSNLLRRARDAGVQLRINEAIIRELAAHFRMIKKRYDEQYAGLERVYNEDLQILYIPEMLIRAYFYSRLRGRTPTFLEFLDAFVSRRMEGIEEDLITWLEEEFGVRFIADKALDVVIDHDEEEALRKELEGVKETRSARGAGYKAKTDARIVLLVHALREKNSEAGSGILGFETWWLSMDTSTERAARRVLKVHSQTSCCIRADFLNQFVSLAPSKAEVDQVFEEAFPGLVGVSLSYHLPSNVIQMTSRLVKEFGERSPGRVKATLRELFNRMKAEPTLAEGHRLRHFLDEQRAELEQTAN